MGRKIMKIMLILLGVLLAGILILLAGAWSMFGEKVTAAGSVRKLEEDLYYMEYKGDYGFDAFLEQGGAASEARMAEYITSFLSGGFVKGGANPGPKNFGCSTLEVNGLMGRNFDWEGADGCAIIIHTKPKHGYESYSTCWLDFLGFGRAWEPEGFANQYMALAAVYVPQDGINEKGLVVADLVNGDNEQTHQRTDKADLTTSTAIRLLLDRAATVDEAIALLEQYDMNSAIGMAHHLAVADASGRSVVVEYVDHKMIVTETPAVTNHYLSSGEKQCVGNEESLTRFDKLLGLREGITGFEEMRHAMEAVSYSGITRWSIVYDQKAGSLDFYWNRQFEAPYHFEIGK